MWPLPQSHRPTFDCEPDLERAFLAWGRRWEQAVHLALAEAHRQDPIKFPASGLGKKHRGRCKPRLCKFVPVCAAARAGRHGDFTPSEEASTVLTRQRVRQVRRLESLLRNLLTHRQRGCPPDGADTLCQQWRAIRNAAGYGQSFVLWTLKVRISISSRWHCRTLNGFVTC